MKSRYQLNLKSWGIIWISDFSTIGTTRWCVKSFCPTGPARIAIVFKLWILFQQIDPTIRNTSDQFPTSSRATAFPSHNLNSLTTFTFIILKKYLPSPFTFTFKWFARPNFSASASFSFTQSVIQPWRDLLGSLSFRSRINHPKQKSPSTQHQNMRTKYFLSQLS